MLAKQTFWTWLTGRPQRVGRSVLEDDRRVWVRQPTDVSTRCAQVGGEGEGVLAVLRDVSRGGVKLLAGRRFEPGAILSVELPGVEGAAVLACVVHAAEGADGNWVMGCRFAAELTDEHLQAFGAARARPTPPDPRQWSRSPCNARASYSLVGAADPSPRPARVLNIAAGGVALLVEEEVAVGSLLGTELCGADGRPVVSILACAVHVRPEGGGRVLGCNFIRALGDDQLNALL